MVGPCQRPAHLGGRCVGERRRHLRTHQRRLRFDVETAEDEGDLVPVPRQGVAADLEGRRRGLAAHPADLDAVTAHLLERDGVESGDDIRPEIAWLADLVEQLGGHGLGGDGACGARVLGDHARAVRPHLGDREAGVAHVVLGEEAEVAAGRLCAAFEDVTGHRRACEGVPVIPPPAEMRRRRADHEARIGHAAGDDHSRPGTEALRDAPRTQVGVGGQRRAQVQAGSPGEQVVALHVGNPDFEAEARRELAQRAGQAGWVEAACVGHDGHAALHREPEALLHLSEERAGVAPIGPLEPLAAEDQHGELCEVVAGEDVDVAALEHLPNGGEPVAVEP